MDNTNYINEMDNNVAASRKEIFESFVKQISEARQALHNAETEESIKKAVEDLDSIITNISYDVRDDRINGLVLDITGTISSFRLHDTTRSSLDDLLASLIKKANEVIAEETKKENAQKLKTLFLELANHSNEISELIDKIFS